LSIELPESGNIGKRTREIIVSRNSCPSLALFGIVLAGVTYADDDFLFVRHTPKMAQLLVSFDGAGEVYVDDAWESCGPGLAYLTPPIAPHAYRSASQARSESGANWVVCWVIYSNDWRSGPAFGVDQPALFRVDGRALRLAIENLYEETVGRAEPAVMQSWTSLVHSYVLRVCAPPSRLAEIWKAVGADLAYPWTLTELSDIIGVTPEQVRRICRRELACSPMHHVTELRMRAAAALLASEFYTVEAVAERVGYDNAFAFSTAFKRRMGITPSDFRRPLIERVRSDD
jgi:AraC-like DNA-binding protein